MRYWFDTEFIEDGKTIDLISIGIVSEDGREFYAESNECDLSKARPWVKENVIPHLIHGYDGRVHKSRKAIANGVASFCGERPEIWAYYADYDWVAMCQLFGTMMDLPKKWPMYCRDVKQLCDALGNPKLPEQGKGKHNALADARWTKLAWEFLSDKEAQEHRMDTNIKEKCCKIGCDALAEYEVRPVPGKAEDETHACAAHIPELMTDATVHEVVRLIEPGNAAVAVYR